jgi:4,5-DOPA dioxygenase extradiol
MPVFFLGHGDPMNALRDNAFTRSLAAAGAGLERRPTAILVVSAHWLTRGAFSSTVDRPETIHDFGGFPDELYQVEYPAPGSPDTARRAIELAPEVEESDEWGLDHGAWSMLRHMFPKADLPAFQLSIDFYKPLAFHLELGRKLAPLREEGVLIIGSGNIVHNLRRIRWGGKAYPWAEEFDLWAKGRIEARDGESLVDIGRAGESAQLAVPTADHYIPLLYTLGAARADDKLEFIYEGLEHGSLSMRCLRFG